MTIICVAVRMKSIRCPNKAMADLAGKTLLGRLIERVSKSEYAEKVIICTSRHPDDDTIEECANTNNVPCVRGSELDVMGRFLTAANIYNAHTIVRVTGDNPLTDPDLMDRMIEHHHRTGADYTTCFDVPRGTRPEIIRTDSLKTLYTQIDPDKSEYMTYQLMEMNNIAVYESGLRRRDVRLTVDTPNDLERMQALYNHHKGNPPSLEKVIEWYDN